MTPLSLAGLLAMVTPQGTQEWWEVSGHVGLSTVFGMDAQVSGTGVQVLAGARKSSSWRPQAGLQMHQAEGARQWLVEAGVRRYFQKDGWAVEPFAEGGVNLPLLQPIGPGVRLAGGAAYQVNDEIQVEGIISHSVGIGDAVSVMFLGLGASYRF
jgi:hypothetical protein